MRELAAIRASVVIAPTSQRPPFTRIPANANSERSTRTLAGGGKRLTCVPPPRGSARGDGRARMRSASRIVEGLTILIIGSVIRVDPPSQAIGLGEVALRMR